ncbi:MAG: hypothetical protein GY791_02005 [Alphaproteobacteria bacterium]|nr:hypothetical protein [Alphaproteobacteria bacterium]
MSAAVNSTRRAGKTPPTYPVFYAHTGGDEEVIVKWQEAFPEQFWQWFKFVRYDEIVEKQDVDVGHYIFADLERLTPEMRVKMDILWKALGDSGAPIRALNNPNRTAMRYELLRRLYDEGYNAYNVYRLTEVRRPERFPVFVRSENDHRGPRSGLVHNNDELDEALDGLIDRGLPRERILIEEFLDTADDKGMYRKYAVFKVGDEIIAAHIFFSNDWLIKKWELTSDDILREEAAFIARNPFEDQIRTVFELANIDYGRIDFSVIDGRIQTWEINTHPIVHGFSTDLAERRQVVEDFFRRLIGAFRAISEGENRARTESVAPPHSAR